MRMLTKIMHKGKKLENAEVLLAHSISERKSTLEISGEIEA